MQLLDRIEKRRFVGREFLLWLWFESEIFDATLGTAEHGTFGFWIEKSFTLSIEKEATRIKGALPAASREAKESLMRGKLPEACGLHISWNGQDTTLTLKADQLAFAGLRLPTVLGGEDEDEAPKLLEETTPQRKPKKRAMRGEDPSDAAHEAFYERMNLTRELEGLIEALYRDFLALRLSDAWNDVVVPAITTWVRGDELDADAYRAASREALPGAKKKRTRSA